MPSPFPNAITPVDDFNSAAAGSGVQCLRTEAHQNERTKRIELTFFVRHTDGREHRVVVDAHGRLKDQSVVAEAVAAARAWASGP